MSGFTAVALSSNNIQLYLCATLQANRVFNINFEVLHLFFIIGFSEIRVSLLPDEGFQDIQISIDTHTRVR